MRTACTCGGVYTAAQQQSWRFYGIGVRDLAAQPLLAHTRYQASLGGRPCVSEGVPRRGILFVVCCVRITYQVPGVWYCRTRIIRTFKVSALEDPDTLSRHPSDAWTHHRALSFPGDFSITSGCALAAGGSRIFGANAICRYFSYKGKSSSPKGKSADPGAVEEWLEWEAVTLAPAERLLAAAEQGGGAAPPEALAALKHLEGKMTGMWLIEGVRLNGGAYEGLVALGWVAHSLTLSPSVPACVMCPRLTFC